MKRLSAGFTLIELLTTIAIVALLSTLLYSGMRVGTDKATLASDAQNMRQIGTAIMAYVSENNGELPGPTWTSQPALYYYNNPTWRSWNLVEFLAPYLDLPTPDATRRIGKIFVSPAYLKNPQGIPLDTVPYMINYLLNNRTQGLPQQPFGNPPGSGPAIPPMRLAAIPNPSKTWMMCSADKQINSIKSYSNLASYAPAPYNTKFRNLLYFDGHVETARTNAVIPNVSP